MQMGLKFNFHISESVVIWCIALLDIASSLLIKILVLLNRILSNRQMASNRRSRHCFFRSFSVAH